VGLKENHKVIGNIYLEKRISQLRKLVFYATENIEKRDMPLIVVKNLIGLVFGSGTHR
jgi:hypothetical protein